jgi:hypothetical protein
VPLALDPTNEIWVELRSEDPDHHYCEIHPFSCTKISEMSSGEPKARR